MPTSPHCGAPPPVPATTAIPPVAVADGAFCHSSFVIRRWSLAFSLVFASLLPAAERPAGERFAEVRSAFEKGDYTRAQYIGESLIKDGHLSPQLFQLLGHIRYRQGDLGRAALWYQRASLFPPPVPEIRQNLAHIHHRTGNLTFPANTFRDQFSARLSRSQWGTVTIVAGWVFVFALILYLFFVRSFPVRTLLMFVCVTALVVGTLAALGWYWHPSYAKVERLAIVTAPNTKAFTAATVTSGSVTALPPGSTVRKLEDRGAWCYVEIPTEGETRRGWVQNDTLTPFWPFDPGYLE